ncbi:MAG: ribonuclease III [Bdellovibrionales bacterium]|nr:ribonuclease III [Bdellovibrionales bacterium]
MKLRARSFVSYLERVLQVTILSEGLLENALMHSSYVNENPAHQTTNNERLEFLGDAVLGIIISEKLYEKFPDHREGKLSKYRSALVNEKSLAECAQKIDLGEYVLLGKGEASTGGKEKPSILSDTYEAVLAALYLENGLELSRKFVLYTMGDRIECADVRVKKHDHKTRFQEWAQRNMKTIPEYIVLSEDGPDHDKVFEICVKIRGKEYARAKGSSKKESEQSCAKIALGMARKGMIS